MRGSTRAQKKNKRFRSEPLQHQRDALLNGFAAYLKARQTTCIHNVEPSAGLRMAKVARVKVLYSSRMQRVFGDARHWQAGLWMSSAVKVRIDWRASWACALTASRRLSRWHR